jgi:hypothetical protein
LIHLTTHLDAACDTARLTYLFPDKTTRDEHLECVLFFIVLRHIRTPRRTEVKGSLRTAITYERRTCLELRVLLRMSVTEDAIFFWRQTGQKDDWQRLDPDEIDCLVAEVSRIWRWHQGDETAPDK